MKLKWLTISALITCFAALIAAINNVDIQSVIAIIGSGIVLAILALAHESGLKS